MDQSASGSSKLTTASFEASTKPSSHTYRIQQIKESVTSEQLRQWLGEISAPTPKKLRNIQALSLAPYNDTQTATITFYTVPPLFQTCSPTQPEMEATFGGKESEVLVDTFPRYYTASQQCGAFI